MKNDFETFYNSIHDEELEEIWKNAKKEKKKRRRIAIPTIMIIDLIVVFFFYNFIENFIEKFINNFFGILPYMIIIFPILIIDLFIYLIFVLIFSKNSSKYNDVFKDKVIDKLFKNFFDSVDYIPKKGMPASVYNEGEYEGFYNRYYSDDYLEGLIDDKYLVKMAEVTTQHVETKTDSDGSTHTETTTIFSGIFAKIKLEKSIENELRIGRDKTISKKKRLEMDSDEFEKAFDVSCTDEIVGMQILTHDIMDILLDYRNRLKMPLDIYIKKDTMYIRLHIGKMFEAVINKTDVIDKKILSKYFDMVEFIYMLSKMMIKIIEDTQI